MLDQTVECFMCAMIAEEQQLGRHLSQMQLIYRFAKTMCTYDSITAKVISSHREPPAAADAHIVTGRYDPTKMGFWSPLYRITFSALLPTLLAEANLVYSYSNFAEAYRALLADYLAYNARFDVAAAERLQRLRIYRSTLHGVYVYAYRPVTKLRARHADIIRVRDQATRILEPIYTAGALAWYGVEFYVNDSDIDAVRVAAVASGQPFVVDVMRKWSYFISNTQFFLDISRLGPTMNPYNGKLVDQT